MRRLAHGPLDPFLSTLAIGGPIVALLAMAMVPPVQGAMLLIPLWVGVSPIRVAFDRSVPVLGRGPGASVIVYGERAALVGPMLRAGLLPVAAPAALCGAARS